jgi:hypothetical protein
MPRFEALYRRCCRTSLNWMELGEMAIFISTDLIARAEETVSHIQENLKAAKSR